VILKVDRAITARAEHVPRSRCRESVTPLWDNGGDRKEAALAKTRVFISFDYDHDLDLKNLLVGQAKNADSPFEIADWSIKTATPGWKGDARKRIRASDVVAVICGEHTDKATGVGVEVSLAQDEKVPYFLLNGRTDKTCKKPNTAKSTDKLSKWTWDNLKVLIGGGR